jgi:hypothetical protein
MMVAGNRQRISNEPNIVQQTALLTEPKGAYMKTENWECGLRR